LPYGILIKFEVKGMHYWPEATKTELAHPHKHNFLVVISLQELSDREIEFIEFRDRCLQWLKESYETFEDVIDFSSRSCEEIAYELAKAISNKLGEEIETISLKRKLRVEVWENESVGAYFEV